MNRGRHQTAPPPWSVAYPNECSAGGCFPTGACSSPACGRRAPGCRTSNRSRCRARRAPLGSRRTRERLLDAALDRLQAALDSGARRRCTFRGQPVKLALQLAVFLDELVDHRGETGNRVTRRSCASPRCRPSRCRATSGSRRSRRSRPGAASRTPLGRGLGFACFGHCYSLKSQIMRTRLAEV
jgi:hypothetical protein